MTFERWIKSILVHVSIKRYSFRFHAYKENLKKHEIYILFFINVGYGLQDDTFNKEKHIFFYFDFLHKYKPTYKARIGVSIPLKKQKKYVQ